MVDEYGPRTHLRKLFFFPANSLDQDQTVQDVHLDVASIFDSTV